MTALTQYQKLECPGLWRDAPSARMRDVVVSFGEATLVFSDPRSEVALSHWSLAAVRRSNPGKMPALYAPGDDANETLELDDLDMIAALATVEGAVAQARARPGRLRGAVLLAGTLAVVALVVLAMPGALYSHTARVLPAAKRAEIGQAALDDLIRLTGAPCTGASGRRALSAMAESLFGRSDTPILLVLPEGLHAGAHLPGGLLLLGQPLLADVDGPEAAAGAALVERARAAANDPLLPILHHAGLRATFQLLTSGELPDAALAGYGARLLRNAAPPASFAAELEGPDAAGPVEAVLLGAFAQAGVPSTPYARHVGGMPGLVSGDPFASATADPLMADGDWISLQDICAG